MKLIIWILNYQTSIFMKYTYWMSVSWIKVHLVFKIYFEGFLFFSVCLFVYSKYHGPYN